MGWYVFQGIIVTAVLFSNVHWKWTPNIYLASFVGFGVAYAATWTLMKIIDWRAARRENFH